jgi:Uncharacterized protein conserved in bacteria (DUF2252)
MQRSTRRYGFERNIAKAREKDSLRASDRLTEIRDGRPRIISDPPLIVPVEELASPEESAELDVALHSVIRSYRRTLLGDRRHLLERFRYADAARKVVGVGTVGIRAWIVLMLGNDDGDPLSCRSRRPGRRCSRPTSATAGSRTTGGGSSRDTG